MHLSFVVPVFNTKVEFFEDCLNSVRRVFGPSRAEIIVCDDGSRTAESESYMYIANRYGANYVKAHRNCGMAVARNTCALLARNDYLFFLDSDDIMEEFAPQVLLEVLATRPTVLIADHVNVETDGCTQLLTRRKSLYMKEFHEFGGGRFDPFLFATFLFHPLIVLRTEFLKAGGFDISFSSGEEVDLHIRITEEAGTHAVAHLPEILYRYRKNAESVVHNPGLYTALIMNIEAILSFHASRRYGTSVAARKCGRSLLTGAAHYSLYDSVRGFELPPPWLNSNYRIVRTD